jgi:hypothetical protein
VRIATEVMTVAQLLGSLVPVSQSGGVDGMEHLTMRINADKFILFVSTIESDDEIVLAARERLQRDAYRVRMDSTEQKYREFVDSAIQMLGLLHPSLRLPTELLLLEG